MLKAFAITLATVSAAGCNGPAEQLTANFQYSNAASLGTQNAGLFEPGSLFLWNTHQNELTFLDVLTLTRTGGSPVPADISSSNVSSIGLSGIPTGYSADLLQASIGAQSTFIAKSAVREDYGKLISALSSYTEDIIRQGADPDFTLKTRDQEFRLVLIRSAVRAANSELRIGGSDATNPNSIASLELGRNIFFKIKFGASTTCSRPKIDATGKLPACFFNVAVFDPEYVEKNPRLQFMQGTADAEKLSSAFRQLR